MICILLSTYNGGAHLEAQLQSLIEQQGVEYFILVRDDGSTDATHEILDRWQAQGKLTWYAGENIKPCASFMHLLRHAPNAEHYAFCDQDDIWMSDKLAAAMPHLGGNPQQPALYFSSQHIVDSELRPITQHTLHHSPSFRRSVTNHIASGCTMVFNHSLRTAVLRHTPQQIYMHDSWIYKVCMAVGGRAYADPNAYILYRQHNSNAVGAAIKEKSGIIGTLIKVIRLHNHALRDEALELYEGYAADLNKSDRAFVRSLSRYHRHLPSKLQLLLNPRCVRETIKGELYYRTTILFNSF